MWFLFMQSSYWFPVKTGVYTRKSQPPEFEEEPEDAQVVIVVKELTKVG